VNRSNKLLSETILYGPRRPRPRKLDPVFSWFDPEPLALNEDLERARGAGDLLDFYYGQERLAEIEPGYHNDFHGVMEGITYCRGEDGERYLAWQANGHSAIGRLDLEARTCHSSHVGNGTELGPVLLPGNGGVIVTWVSQQGQHAYLKRAEMVDDFFVFTTSLDLSDGPASALASARSDQGHPWVAWASRDRRSGRWQIRAGRGDLRHPEMTTIVETDVRPDFLEVRVAGDRAVVLWKNEGSQTLYYGDPKLEGEAIELGSSSGPLGWEVLPSGEIVIAWTDDLVSNSLLVVSINGDDPREISAVVAAGLVAGAEQISVGIDPGGVARVCWLERVMRFSGINSLEYRDGTAGATKKLVQGLCSDVELFSPLSTSSRMVLPYRESGGKLLGITLR
jgi:hypothetical protein